MQASSVYPPPRRLKDPEDLQLWNSRTLAGDFDLDVSEQEWRDRSEFLKAHGYLLRPRFRNGWKPSWLGTDLHPHNCEDFHKLISIRIIDAMRVSDNKRVVLKRVRRDAKEIGLAQSLHTDGQADDPDNHCVPILDYFDDKEDSTLGFLVMPLLRRFNNPEFGYINEVIDFIRQTLIGLRYLHRKKIAHRDLSGLNIMMDGDPLYPTGFHPSRQSLNPVTTAFANYLDRRDVPTIKYYIIDYGISSAFNDQGKSIRSFKIHKQLSEIPGKVDVSSKDAETFKKTAQETEELEAKLRAISLNIDIQPPAQGSKVQAIGQGKELPPFMVYGRNALDREVPELSNKVPYNPFLVDIFTLGNVYKNNFLKKYSNMGFLSPLAESMTQTDPQKRPSVDEAIHHFESIVSSMSRFKLCLPLRPLEEPKGRYAMAFEDVKAIVRECWVLTWDGIKILLLPPWLRVCGSSILAFIGRAALCRPEPPSI